MYFVAAYNNYLVCSTHNYNQIIHIVMKYKFSILSNSFKIAAKEMTFILISMYLFGCNESQKQIEVKYDHIIVPTPSPDNKQPCLSDVANRVEFVELETTDSSMLVKVDMIAINEKFIVVKDRLGDKISVFNRSGKHKFNLQEISFKHIVSRVTDIRFTNIDDIAILLAEHERSLLLEFDSRGNLKDSMYLTKAFHFDFTDSGIIILYHAPPFHEYNQFNLFSMLSNTYQIADRYINSTFSKDVDNIMFCNNYKISGHYVFWDCLTASKYHFTSDGVLSTVTYVEPIEEIRIPNEMKVKAIDLQSSMKNKMLITTVFESPDYVFILTIFQQKRQPIVYSKSTKEFMYVYKEDDSKKQYGLADNINGICPFWPQGMTEDGGLFCCMERKDIVDFLGDNVRDNGRVNLHKLLEGSSMNNPIIEIIN